MNAAARNHCDADLIERARIAYFKAGGIDQPSDASEVVKESGITTITLRNINGVLAMYRFGGASLKRANMITEGGRA
jgi:hypothetical protein